jgi:hypothetical protein
MNTEEGRKREYREEANNKGGRERENEERK